MSSNIKQAANVAAPVVKRDVNKWIARIRQFFMLRDFDGNQRHEFEWSKRTQPQPLLPAGFAHKLSKNYYFDRDARRQVSQPQLVFSSTAATPFLPEGAAPAQLTAAGSAPTPTTPTSTSVTAVEAEKQAAAYMTSLSNKNEKRQAVGRTPGKVYNWDG